MVGEFLPGDVMGIFRDGGGDDDESGGGDYIDGVDTVITSVFATLMIIVGMRITVVLVTVIMIMIRIMKAILMIVMIMKIVKNNVYVIPLYLCCQLPLHFVSK